ncbi:hybrid nucleoside-diphosphate sugar epimerase/sugar transferase [Devosia salina]|uniref:Sugar transferase n=1 Tax=Devosia salina TaxID=2860336 RepID=A0ABX8WGA2_9HYPH|nr:hybrid nucleoside-diphosphate sugar epimerase/sugar transferase [Devosia salina]QYO77788.1 sugar transferase [Devosia salina]
MRIAISGASGRIGRQLVPHLLARGIVPLLVGRDPRRLQTMFPECPSAGYKDLATSLDGVDLFVHMAAINNDSDESAASFEAVNVDLAAQVCAAAADAGVDRFVYVSSLHALDENSASDYARTKRLGADQVLSNPGIDVRVVYLPAIAGERFSGKLSLLNHLPRQVGRAMAYILSAFRPTLSLSKVMPLFVDPAFFTDKENRVVLTQRQANNLVYRGAKRAVDLGFALAILVFFWWLLAIIWIVVCTTSRGPGLFRQIRVGRGGKTFTCYKFRTMYLSTPQAATHEISQAAVTDFGSFLRRTKLDELPQIFNIFANQMSLVGPRPCLPSQKELILERQRRGVLDALPGITGLAQVNNIDMADPQLLSRYDQAYVQRQSLLLDLQIIWQTLFGAGAGDRVAV